MIIFKEKMCEEIDTSGMMDALGIKFKRPGMGQISGVFSVTYQDSRCHTNINVRGLDLAQVSGSFFTLTGKSGNVNIQIPDITGFRIINRSDGTAVDINVRGGGSYRVIKEA
jgi:hypothetical protein